jgi:L-iditol 2-dehydrogenase
VKAVELYNLYDLRLTELAEPKLMDERSVRLQVLQVGICGSDVHYYRHGRIGDQIIAFPHIIGHECSARVLQVGAEVQRIKVGDLVAVDPAVSCMECDQCQAGRYHTCRKIKFLSAPGQAAGCLAEQVVVPERNCFVVPLSLGAERAALAEPLTIGWYTILKAGALQDLTMAILGCGPIGLSCLLAAKLAGARKMYATEKLLYRLDMAVRNGALAGGLVDRDDIIGNIRKEEPQMLDVVIECCGQQAALDQAVQLLKPGGRLVIAGIPEEDRVSFNISELRRKELTVINIRRQNECVEPVLEAMAHDRLQADFMITHRFPLEETAEAFRLVADYKDHVVKAMIKISD